MNSKNPESKGDIQVTAEHGNSNYIKQLEEQNEELKETLGKLQYEHQAWVNALTPYWTKATYMPIPDLIVTRYTTGLFTIARIKFKDGKMVNRNSDFVCTLAEPMSDYTPFECKSLEEAKAWAEKKYFDFIHEHHDKKQWGNPDWRI